MWPPFPKFYILRPDAKQVPLIPLDELPSWLQIGFLDWNDPKLYMFMIPATTSIVPREGEYDVICQYCLNSVDNTLHRSASESGNDIGSSICATHSRQKATKSPSAVDIAALVPQTIASYKELSGLSKIPVYDKDIPIPTAYSGPLLQHPPFHSVLQRPIVGMCVIRVAEFMWGLLPTMTSQPPLANGVPVGEEEEEEAWEGEPQLPPPNTNVIGPSQLDPTGVDSEELDNALERLRIQSESSEFERRDLDEEDQRSQHSNQSQQGLSGSHGSQGPPGPPGPSMPGPASASDPSGSVSEQTGSDYEIPGWMVNADGNPSELDLWMAEIPRLGDYDPAYLQEKVASMLVGAYQKGLQDRGAAKKRVLGIHHENAQLLSDYSHPPLSNWQALESTGRSRDAPGSKYDDGEEADVPDLQNLQPPLDEPDNDGNTSDDSQKQQDSSDEDENDSQTSNDTGNPRDPKDPEDPQDPPDPQNSSNHDYSEEPDDSPTQQDDGHGDSDQKGSGGSHSAPDSHACEDDSVLRDTPTPQRTKTSQRGSNCRLTPHLAPGPSRGATLRGYESGHLAPVLRSRTNSGTHIHGTLSSMNSVQKKVPGTAAGEYKIARSSNIGGALAPFNRNSQKTSQGRTPNSNTKAQKTSVINQIKRDPTRVQEDAQSGRVSRQGRITKSVRFRLPSENDEIQVEQQLERPILTRRNGGNIEKAKL
ncbi:hypothetical protein ASPVEDRAFT_81688 [Aspergillus versicolor CBS 583.65]|uniref:Uncharacterized protein n=1 Tax=Aspergillus versicolor CBS 583.65 TaxID=1036611 RepID=A0A1L9PF02_ASPVE|nr:uncharacterized protein ASPVEDRAFT_81688 [Aspergillus versicolor CBS 583.65]OJJ00108.1 hypothetical protein ASPVEDRAFT_81688 [Aspergillus versicolor CBS 583.65]